VVDEVLVMGGDRLGQRIGGKVVVDDVAEVGARRSANPSRFWVATVLAFWSLPATAAV
jgi:hypothetical protein